MLSHSHMANMKTKIFFVLDLMLKKNSFAVCMKVGIKENFSSDTDWTIQKQIVPLCLKVKVGMVK